MHIKIAERLRPFSHTPGVYCILPYTSLRLQIFPTLIRVYDLSNQVPILKQEIHVPLKGPMKDFTIQLDLEIADIKVFGESSEGYFRYSLFADLSGNIAINVEKGLSNWTSTNEKNLRGNPFIERLSFGGHKKQDFDCFNLSPNLVDILPIWFRMGQLIDYQANIVYEGTAALLKKCEIATNLEAYEHLFNLYKAGFEGILSPRLVDEQYQGFDLPSLTQSTSPLILLSEGAKIIRSFFFRQEGNQLSVLPCLPTQFHCGRYLQIQCADLGFLDFEWTKKTIRRMVFHAKKDAFIDFKFPKTVNNFRLNKQALKVGEPIEVKKDHMYLFDNFQS